MRSCEPKSGVDACMRRVVTNKISKVTCKDAAARFFLVRTLTYEIVTVAAFCEAHSKDLPFTLYHYVPLTRDEALVFETLDA